MTLNRPAQAGRDGYVIIPAHAANEYILVRDCPFCKKEARVTIPAQGLWDWEHGAFVQVAMPDLNADEREIVISGTHPECWDKNMPDPED